MLRLAGAEDAEGAEEPDGLSMLGNCDPMVAEDRTDSEVKENIQGDLLGNVDIRGGTTIIQGGDNKEEQAPDLNQKRISAISVMNFVFKPAHKKLSEIALVAATGANESSEEPRYMKDLREKKYTILELKEQEGVFRQDVRLSFKSPFRTTTTYNTPFSIHP